MAWHTCGSGTGDSPGRGYDVLLPVGQLHTGKNETHGIERDNARQRHWLARFSAALDRRLEDQAHGGRQHRPFRSLRRKQQDRRPHIYAGLIPSSTGVWMSVPSILRLIESFPQIKVVKEEDLPSLEKFTQLRARQGRRVSIMTGNNGLYLPYEMARGIDGPMAGFSHP